MNPPGSFMQRLRFLGPGFILSASIVGSGELIATTTLGAKAGYVAFWVIIVRSEEHTSELQSLMRISYAVFCFQKKTTIRFITNTSHGCYAPTYSTSLLI